MHPLAPKMLTGNSAINAMSKSKFYGGLFLITSCTLMLQVLQTRILSVVAWYHLAFFAISMAMFGLCLLYTSPSPRDRQKSRMPSSA